MTSQPGWHPDPVRRFEFRYWDGASWTDHVSSGGIAEVDSRPVTDPGLASAQSGVVSNGADVAATRIMSKGANALFEQPSFHLPHLAGIALEQAGAAPGSVGWVLERYRRRWGGLWVGGRVTLSTARVAFSPNAMNRAVLSGAIDVDIPLVEIVQVEVLPGVVTKIVAIRTMGGVLKVRCYGAPSLAKAIEDARGS